MKGLGPLCQWLRGVSLFLEWDALIARPFTNREELARLESSLGSWAIGMIQCEMAKLRKEAREQ